MPTNGDLAKIDPKTGHVLKLYGALIDASVGMDATVALPEPLDASPSSARGAPDPGDTGCGDGVPCQRFSLYIQNLRTHKAPRISS